MKKTYLLNLLLAITVFISLNDGYAQCTPGSYTAQGFYPNPLIGLDSAYAGIQYYDTITVVVPTDTMRTIPVHGTLNLDVNYYRIDSIVGLPTGYTYECSTIDCKFLGGSSGCMAITGPAPTVSQMGQVYPFTIYYTPNYYHSSLGDFDYLQEENTDYNIAVSANLLNNCAPNPQYITSGIHPSPMSGLKDAYVGDWYVDTMTVVVPADSNMVVSGIPGIDVNIDYFHLYEIDGLPTGFYYSCSISDCKIPGGSSGCVTIFGTPPTANMVGHYPLTITYYYYGYVPIINDYSNAGFTTTMDYDIDISIPTSMGESKGNELTIYPNPSKGIFNYEFIADNTNAILNVFDHTGRLVVTENFKTLEGSMVKRSIDLTNQASGMYHLQLINTDKVLNQKLILK